MVMGMMCHQTAGNNVLGRSSLRGTKQSRKQYNALFITGLLRKLAMTAQHDGNAGRHCEDIHSKVIAVFA